MTIKVTGLTFYPIKACAGTAVDKALIGLRGLAHDREWLVVDPKGEFQTQRDHPSMALIHPSLEPENLVLSAPGLSSTKVPLNHSGGTSMQVTVWKDTCEAEDQGDEVAEWLSGYMKMEVRLVRMKREYVRRVDKRASRYETEQLGFADAYPFLLISQESLDDLNSRMEQPLPMNRFRPNIVVSGCQPFDEDRWQQISIAGITFDVVKPCERCVVTTTDQATAQRGKEPLKTLATYRKVGDNVLFGQNLVHHSTGSIAIGDEVTIKSP